MLLTEAFLSRMKQFLKNVVFSIHTWIHSGKNKEPHPSIIRPNVHQSRWKLWRLSTAFQRTGCDVKRARGARRRVELLHLILRNKTLWWEASSLPLRSKHGTR